MIAWFARNGVSANLLMMIIIVGGVVSLLTIPRQLFPEFSIDVVTVTVPYPGSTPSENEDSICKRIEEEIQDLEGVKKMTSMAYEGFGVVSVEVERGYDPEKMLDDVKSRIDTITNFPEEAEEAQVEKVTITQDIMALTIVGNADERTLKTLGEDMRDELLEIPGITQVRIDGVRDYEVSVTVSEQTLRQYSLTFDDVVRAIQQGSIDLPAGVIRAEGGEILLRTKGQAYTGEDFARVVLLTQEDGTYLTLGDIADVVDGFEDQQVRSEQWGVPAVNMTVEATSSQNVLEISRKVKEFTERKRSELPEGIEIIAWADRAFYLEGRLDMLVSNGIAGLILVLAALTMFLRPSLALWVTMGIPISFLGSFFVLGWTGDFSINIVSLFGFIMVLGIIVDDAIVVGESVFTQYQKDGPGVESAIKGSQAVAMPVTFAVLTSAVAFIPIFFLPGFFGKILQPIPLVVISALLFSLIESKLILPHHLSWCKVGGHERERINRFQRFQRGVSDKLERFIDKGFRPFLDRALRSRYVTVSIFLAVFIVAIGLIQGNHIRLNLHPEVPSDYIFVNLTMAEGTPFERTEQAADRMIRALNEVVSDLEEKGMSDPLYQVQAVVGQSMNTNGPTGGTTQTASNTAFFVVEMQKSEERVISAPEFADLWRDEVGSMAGARELRFNAYAGGGGGPALDIQISGEDFEVMSQAAAEVTEKLRTFEGVLDVRDNFSGGKRELQLAIKPSAEMLGLKQADLARQVRQAFYGEEAQRVQRGKHDVRVMVRYPDEERRSLGNLEDMRIRTADGREVPFYEVAEATMGRSSAKITRVDRERVINIQADADKKQANLPAIREALSKDGTLSFPEKIQKWLHGLPLIGSVVPEPVVEVGFMPKLMERYPGLSWSFQGETREQTESMDSLLKGGALVLFAIYALMAVPFRSYSQPLIVMAVIPFGLVGAVLGHLAFGRDMNMLSLLGCLALAGVLVNDSLVLVDYINQRVRAGEPLLNAVRDAGARRFRPILLTSLTTFAGLTPILLERSLQAQFLIPMAISLAFGILFGTIITLMLVPCIYLMLEDFKRFMAKKLVRLLGRDPDKSALVARLPE